MIRFREVLGPVLFPKLWASVLTLAVILIWLEPQQAIGHHTPASTPSGQASLNSSFSDPGVQAYNLESTATLAVANFDDFALSDTFPSSGVTVSGVGTFRSSATAILGDSYYRAGDSGRYLRVQDMTLELADTSDFQYVGFYWSGGNAENHVQLLSGNDTVLAEFSADIPGSNEDVFGRTGACDGTRTDYCGSPNASGQDNDRYAFIHLRYEPGFRKIRFYGYNFEVDNVTVSQTMPGVSANETDTQDFQPYTITEAPGVIVADPRASSVSFPGLTLGAGSGETQAMLCFSQVAQGGAALGVSPTLTPTGTATGVTTSSATNLRAYAGARATIENFSSSIDLSAISAGQAFGVGSLYVRVTATPQANIGTSGCTGDNTVSRIIEVRFLNLLQSNSIRIEID